MHCDDYQIFQSNQVYKLIYFVWHNDVLQSKVQINMGDLLYHRRNLFVCISYYTFLLCFTTCFGY
jgi:hypothetical protein